MVKLLFMNVGRPIQLLNLPVISPISKNFESSKLDSKPILVEIIL